MAALNPQTHSLIISRLGETGLQNAMDVIAFLKTPSGLATVNSIAIEWEKIIALEDQQLRVLLENALMCRLAMMYMLEQEELREERIARQSEDEGQISVKKTQKQVTTEPKHFPQNEESRLTKKIQSDIEEIERIQKELCTSIDEITQLEEKSSALDEKIAQVQATNQQVEEKLNELHELIHQTCGITDFTDTNAEFIDLAIEQVTAQMNQVRQQMQSSDTSAATQISEEASSTPLITESLATRYYLSALNDVMSVLNGEHVFFGEKGQKARHLHEAHFVVHKDFKIIRLEDGDYYLIAADKDIDQLDDVSRLSAKEAYELQKDELLYAGVISQRAFQTELRPLYTEQQQLHKEIELKREGILSSTTRLVAANTNVYAEISRLSQLSGTSIPPTPKLTPESPTPKEAPLKSSYHAILAGLKALTPPPPAASRESSAALRGRRIYMDTVSNLRRLEEQQPNVLERLGFFNRLGMNMSPHALRASNDAKNNRERQNSGNR